MTRRTTALVFLIAAAARLALWAAMRDYPAAYLRPDSADYLRLAGDLLGRGAFGTDALPETFRTPGYPALLALLRLAWADPRWAALLNVVLDSCAAALVAATAGRLAPGRWSWTAGLLYALEPAAAGHAALVLSEAPFNLALTLGLHALLRAGPEARPRWAAAGGLALAAAALIRPVALYLWIPLALTLASLWGRRGAPALLGFLLGAVLPVALWCLRNLALFGHFAFTSLPGTNLLLYEASAVKSAAEGGSSASAARALQEEFARENPGPITNPFERSRLQSAHARRYLFAHPGAALRAHAAAALKLLAGPAIDLIDEELAPGRARPPQAESGAGASGRGTLALARERPALGGLLIFAWAWLAAAYAAAAAGARRLWAGARFGAAVILTAAAYLLAVSVGGWAYYRFRVPLWPCVCLLAAGAFSPGPRRREESARFARMAPE